MGIEKKWVEGNSENTEIVSIICKIHYVMKAGCVELQTSKQ